LYTNVHKFLPGDVIGRIGPIKILMHIFQFFGAIICKWLHSFVPQAFVVLFAKVALASECRPLGTSEAKAIGFIDDCFGESVNEFEEILTNRALKLAQPQGAPESTLAVPLCLAGCSSLPRILVGWLLHAVPVPARRS
jgi:hypothetical protein